MSLIETEVRDLQGLSRESVIKSGANFAIQPLGMTAYRKVVEGASDEDLWDRIRVLMPIGENGLWDGAGATVPIPLGDAMAVLNVLLKKINGDVLVLSVDNIACEVDWNRPVGERHARISVQNALALLDEVIKVHGMDAFFSSCGEEVTINPNVLVADSRFPEDEMEEILEEESVPDEMAAGLAMNGVTRAIKGEVLVLVDGTELRLPMESYYILLFLATCEPGTTFRSRDVRESEHWQSNDSSEADQRHAFFKAMDIIRETLEGYVEARGERGGRHYIVLKRPNFNVLSFNHPRRSRAKTEVMKEPEAPPRHRYSFDELTQMFGEYLLQGNASEIFATFKYDQIPSPLAHRLFGRLQEVIEGAEYIDKIDGVRGRCNPIFGTLYKRVKNIDAPVEVFITNKPAKVYRPSHEDQAEGDWQEFANCLGVDPDLFFPERGASTREAKEVCRGCTVREECLEYALENGEKFGIWGGRSERERRRLRRQLARSRDVTA